MDAIHLISSYFWILGIVFAIVNSIVFWLRMKKANLNDAQVLIAKGLIQKQAVLLSAPWLVMGLSMQFGGISSLFSFFKECLLIFIYGCSIYQ